MTIYRIANDFKKTNIQHAQHALCHDNYTLIIIKNIIILIKFKKLKLKKILTTNTFLSDNKEPGCEGHQP